MERNMLYRSDTSRNGFTLTELMVAMAIFLLLMTGLATMFNAAVTSARQGYASIDAYENARAAMTTIDRDLSGAFVSDEFGDVYNFYGRPDGFMFVGALEDGELGRVTYVFHPEVAKPGLHPVLQKPAYESEIMEQWGVVRELVARQFRRLAWEGGYAGGAADTYVNGALAAFDGAYPIPAAGAQELVEFKVLLETESLIRVEERGIADLDTFNMVVDSAGAVDLAWNDVYVDPLDPNKDSITYAAFDANEAPQFEYLLGALDNTPLADPNDDLRTLYRDINSGGWTHPITGDTTYLRVFNRNTFETILQARKREFWIRMLSGDDMWPTTIPELSKPLPATQLINGSWGYWYDEGFGADNLLDRRTVNEYVVADGIIARAVLLDPNDGSIVVDPADSIPLDALDAEVKFSYSDGVSDNGSVNYFNAIENLADPDNLNGMNLPTLVRSGVLVEQDVLEVDGMIADNHLSTNRITRKNMGSPLLPRLPAVVTPELWVTRAKTRPGSPGFRRRFVQGIQVPAASGRTPPTFIARSPGSL